MKQFLNYPETDVKGYLQEPTKGPAGVLGTAIRGEPLAGPFLNSVDFRISSMDSAWLLYTASLSVRKQNGHSIGSRFSVLSMENEIAT